MRKFLSYFIIVFVLFVSSGSSFLAGDKNVLIGGWVFFTVIHLYLEKSLKFLYLKLLGIFILISVGYYLKNGGYDAVTYLGFFLRVSLAYYCRDICKENFFPYFVQVVFIGAAISIPLFIIQLINFNFLYQINSILAGNNISNSFFFTMVPIHEIRNCGFMWEPGAFSAVVTLALYIHIFSEEEALFSTKNKVFALALLTTQSTMGFLSLFIPIVMLLKDNFSENKLFRQLSVFILPVFIVSFYLLFSNLTFLSKKITKEFNNVETELALIEEGQKYDFVVAYNPFRLIHYYSPSFVVYYY